MNRIAFVLLFPFLSGCFDNAQNPTKHANPEAQELVFSVADIEGVWLTYKTEAQLSFEGTRWV